MSSKISKSVRKLGSGEKRPKRPRECSRRQPSRERETPIERNTSNKKLRDGNLWKLPKSIDSKSSVAKSKREKPTEPRMNRLSVTSKQQGKLAKNVLRSARRKFKTESSSSRAVKRTPPSTESAIMLRTESCKLLKMRTSKIGAPVRSAESGKSSKEGIRWSSTGRLRQSEQRRSASNGRSKNSRDEKMRSAKPRRQRRKNVKLRFVHCGNKNSKINKRLTSKTDSSKSTDSKRPCHSTDGLRQGCSPQPNKC